MKTIYCLFFSMLIGLGAIASDKREKVSVIEGKILNTGGVKELVIREYGLPFGVDIDQKVALTKDGTFSAELKHRYAQYYMILVNRRQLQIFVKPGDKMKFEFDLKNPAGTAKFSGDGEKPNQYLAERQRIDARYMSGQHIYRKEKQEFFTWLDEKKGRLTEHLEKFKNGKTFKGEMAEFVKLEQAHIDGGYGFDMMKYPGMYAYLNKADGAAVWNGYDITTAMEIYDAEDQSLLASKTYRDYLNQTMFGLLDRELQTKKIALSSKIDLVKSIFVNIPNIYKEKWAQDYLQTRVLYEHAFRGGVSGLEPEFEQVRNGVENERYLAAINEIWKKWGHLSEGKPAPDFTARDVDGKEVKLSDFKGKIVYVDVWATWCGPCKREIPFLTKVEKEFHGKDVVFLSVSTDRDENRWKKYVKEKDLQGVQVFTPGGWSSSICKEYNISGIPRFMLIDAEGKIISINAPRPSQGIGNVLNQLLAKNP